MIETVECDASVTCRLTVTVTPCCPIKDEDDEYRVAVEWSTDGRTIEKHSLRDYLKGYDGVGLTQESLVSEVHRDLHTTHVYGITDVSVTAQDTEHMDMVVTK